jgi:DNA-binding CsgD family transcriptional regulator
MSEVGTNSSAGQGRANEPSLESATWKAFLDRPSAEVLLEAIEFLGGTPNPHSLCRHLTLNVAAETRPVGALIAVLEADGTLRIAGSFGIDDEMLTARASQTIADDSPLAETIRSGRPTFYANASEIRRQFPDFVVADANIMPTAIWPIASHGERIGAIQLFFNEHSSESPLTADFEAVVALIALYARLQFGAGMSGTRWSTVDRRQSSTGSAAVSDRRRPSGIAELTVRQTVVLDHICAGRTNAQIAHVVGFSESTVRQETMAIYRTLGVEGRGQAATLARAHRAEAVQAALAPVPSA